MATGAHKSAGANALAPDTYERVLSAGAVILLTAVAAALFKGRAHWPSVPLNIWVHLVTVLIAVTLTPFMLLRRRGTPLHRQLGWVWASAMILTALASLSVRYANHGGFSIIHFLSVFTLVQVPLIVWSARTHNLKRHRQSVRAMVTGALLIAGFFTFPFDRLLGLWLFS